MLDSLRGTYRHMRLNQIRVFKTRRARYRRPCYRVTGSLRVICLSARSSLPTNGVTLNGMIREHTPLLFRDIRTV